MSASDYGTPVGPQEARQMAAMLPSCPGCGAHNASDDDPDLAVIRRTPKAEPLAQVFPYTCGSCWTMFAGTDEEWRRMRQVRETRQELAAKRAASADPEGRRRKAELERQLAGMTARRSA